MGTEEIDTQPTLGFQRVIQRAIMHVQSTSNGKKEVTGDNVLVAIFGEKDSHAVYYLHQQGVTRLDVVNFETRYDQGARSAPTVVVAVRCLISRSSDRKLLEDRLFTANVRASENRVGAIVPAYNKALSEVMTQVLALASTMGPPDQAQPSPSTVGRNG